MLIDLIPKSKILILGYGREGQSTLKFLQTRFPNQQFDHTDIKDGPDYLHNLQNYSLVFKTPGISPHLPEIVAAQQAGVQFSSHMQLFFEVCPSKNIIGITGTKGKSTTTSLIYHILQENRVPSVLVGNIGKPALDYLDQITSNTWVVCELSSYQLMDLTISPHIAVLLDIVPDHLDYHLSFEEYQTAKLNIAKYQTPQDHLVTNITAPAQPIPSQLHGKHNQINISAAMAVTKILSLPDDKVLSAITTFQPLETRLQLVATKNSIRFYADTLATIPQATMAAIDALGPDVHTLIAGGHDRKQDYHALGQKILDSNIQTLILFPTTGERLWQAVNSSQVKHFFATSMSEAVNLAFQHTPPDKICLLSPAAPSFSLFKDYRDEHQQFVQAIAKHAS